MGEIISILLIIIFSQFVTSVIIILSNKNKVIESNGPDINKHLPNVYDKHLHMQDKDALIIYINPQCNTCKDIIKNVQENYLKVKNIVFLTYGEKKEIDGLNAIMNINNLIVLSESVIKKDMKITLFPFAIIIKNNIVVKKDIATNTLVKEFVEMV